MRSLCVTLPLVILGCFIFINKATAQINPDNSLGTESSIVNPDVIKGIPSDRIDGGAKRGSNLFHSFKDFNVDANRPVYFSNPADIANIITRVTGGNPSNILGKLGVLGNANLFLLNPKGIYFGPNASLDLGGSFFGTTADSFIFNDNFEFSATNPQAVPLLSVNIPIGLRFRENPGSIQIQGDGLGLRSTAELINTTSELRVQPNQTLALVGGDLFLEGATLKTAGGRIELGSVAGSGLVSITPINKGFALGYGNVQNFGNIQLSQQAAVDASGLGGGDIQVWGRRITLANGSQIEASPLGPQQAGLLLVNATEQVEIIGSYLNFPSALATYTYSGTTGAAGDVIVNTGELLLRNGGQIIASTFGVGNAGRIIINATGNISADGFGTEIFSAINDGGVGNSGGIEINTNNLSLTNGAQIFASNRGQGNAGSIQINTKDLSLTNFGQIDASTSGRGNAGSIEINTNNLSLIDGAGISASTYGAGNAGRVIINATGNISASNGFTIIPSGIFSFVNPTAQGDAGDIRIRANNLFLNNRAQINASTFGNGEAGNITILTAKDIRLNNQASINAFTTGGQGNIKLFFRDLILRNNSNITTVAQGSANAGNTNLFGNGFIILLKNSSIDSIAEKGFEGKIGVRATGIFVSRDSNIGDFDPNPQSALTFEVPEIVIDPSRQIAQNPCQKGSGSSFIITGRGGFPSSPNDGFSNNETRVDLVEPVASSNSQAATTNQSITHTNAKPIIPAQGWIFNSKGEVVLTAYDPTTTTTAQRSFKPTAACPAF
ncbi:hypothetical protein AMR41_12995 [Hapalosiphon sp. MRB220]|nr:hypothetical protein AMR41_12995 [Hapalosiphon sp. MRB220]